MSRRGGSWKRDSQDADGIPGRHFWRPEALSESTRVEGLIALYNPLVVTGRLSYSPTESLSSVNSRFSSNRDGDPIRSRGRWQVCRPCERILATFWVKIAFLSGAAPGRSLDQFPASSLVAASTSTLHSPKLILDFGLRGYHYSFIMSGRQGKRSSRLLPRHMLMPRLAQVESSSR